MKNRWILTIVVILLGMMLVSCTGATATNSWAGATAHGDMVYFANSGQVYAMRADNGNLAWTYPEKATANRLFFAQPVISGEQVIVGDYGNKLTSLSLLDGMENWMFEGAKGRYIDSPLIVNDMIIAPNADYSVYALDLSGNLIWTFTGTHAFWARPESDGETLYIPCLDHYLYAIDLSTGNLLWKTDLSAALVSRPLLDENGVIYLGNLDNQFFAVNAEDGSKKWQVVVGGGVWAQAIQYEGTLYFGDQTGRINILNAEDGKSAQYVETDGAILGRGALLEEGIVFGNENGNLLLIGFDGKKIWTRTVDGKLYANLVYEGDQLFVTATQGEKPLVSLDSNGNENWYFSEKK